MLTHQRAGQWDWHALELSKRAVGLQQAAQHDCPRQAHTLAAEVELSDAVVTKGEERDAAEVD